MPTGSFDFAPYGTQVALDAVPIGVFQYFSASSEYAYLPNLRCEQIQYKEGHEPPTARFSYVLDELATAANGWPDQFEQVWPINVKPGFQSYTVTPVMQLIVLALMPDNTTRPLFHGFPRIPQADVSPANQHVTFTAVGVAVRCWDQPIGGRIQRAGSDPQADYGQDSDVGTDLPTRFNPSGTGTRAVGGILPNCTPDGYDVNVAYQSTTSGSSPYPVFLDSSIDRTPDPRTQWNLSKAVRYILGTANTAKDPNGDLWVDNPDFTVLDSLLQNRQPLKGSSFFDPSDPSTYTTEPNLIRDFDATNKAWPDVVGQLLGFYGFAMRFVLEDGGDGTPYNYLEIYRKDAAGPTAPKAVYLPGTGASLTDGPVNLSAFHAGFDFHGVANDIFVESRLERYEVSIVLAPEYEPESGDGDAANRTGFLKSWLDTQGATSDDRLAYRSYGVDECQDGHWSIQQQAWVNEEPFDFGELLTDGEGNADYCLRYRPGKGTLFSKDFNNKPYRAQLAVSTDYAGDDPPAFWDGTGTWQEISADKWDLQKDRLGVLLTAEDVETCGIGAQKKGNAPNGQPWPYPDGKFRGITGMSDPANKQGEKQFFLRLTTVIEGDRGIGTEAQRRDASPLAQTIQRRVDASDHFAYDYVDTSSIYNVAGATGYSNGDQIAVQDDSTEALAHACQLRSAHEFPPLTAALTIPMLVNYLQIGDRIGTINGRNVSLLVNAGAEQGEPASYPFVVALTWDFQGDKQSTTLQLSDRRAEPRRPTA